MRSGTLCFKRSRAIKEKWIPTKYERKYNEYDQFPGTKIITVYDSSFKKKFNRLL